MSDYEFRNDYEDITTGRLYDIVKEHPGCRVREVCTLLGFDMKYNGKHTPEYQNQLNIYSAMRNRLNIMCDHGTLYRIDGIQDGSNRYSIYFPTESSARKELDSLGVEELTINNVYEYLKKKNRPVSKRELLSYFTGSFILATTSSASCKMGKILRFLTETGAIVRGHFQVNWNTSVGWWVPEANLGPTKEEISDKEAMIKRLFALYDDGGLTSWDLEKEMLDLIR